MKRRLKGSFANRLIAVGCVAALLGACADDQEADGDPSPDQAADSDDDLTTGAGVTDSEIRYGHLTDLTGAFGPVGEAYLLGAQIFVEELNENGGICDRDVVLDVQDHGYEVQSAVTNYQSMRGNVIGMQAVLGGPMAAQLMADFESDDMVFSPLTWSGDLLESPLVMMPGASYEVQGANGVAWLTEERGLAAGDTVGVITFEGAVGNGLIRGVEAAAEARDLTVSEQIISPTDADMSAPLQSLQNQDATAVVMIVTAVQVGAIMSQAEAMGYDIPFVGGAPGIFDADLLQSPAADIIESNLVITATQAPYAEDSPTAQRVRDAYEAADSRVPPNFGILLGYAQADMFSQAVSEACDSGDLSPAGVVAALQVLDAVDTGGLVTELDFTNPGFSPTRETFMLEPDRSAEGGLVRITEPFTADEVAQSEF